MTRRVPLAQLAVVVILSLLAGFAFDRVFRWQDVAMPVVAAVLGAVGTAIVARVRPRPHAALSALVSVVGFVFVTDLVVVHSLAPEMIRDGLANGWAQILSATTPAPPDPTMLVFPVAVVWLGAAFATELLLRTRRILLPILPPVLIGCTALAFSEHASGSWAVETGLFVVAAGALAAIRSQAFHLNSTPFDQRPGVDSETLTWPSAAVGHRAVTSETASVLGQRLLTTAPLLVIVAILAPLIAGRLTFVDTGHSVSLRDHYRVPTQTNVELNPLARIGSASKGSPPAFSVTLDRVPPGTVRFQLTVLDGYDGEQWTSGGLSITAGPVLPAGDVRSSPLTRVHQSIEVDHLDGQWLPTLDRAVAIDVSTASPVQVDPIAGTLVASGSQAQVNGLRYEVTSEVASADPGRLAAAEVASGAAARSSVAANPDVPLQVSSLLKTVMGTAGTPFQQLARLLAYFRNELPEAPGPRFKVDDRAPSGPTWGNVLAFAGPSGTHLGPAQSFNAAFAALARAQGFPARLVVGYAPAGPVRARQRFDVKQSDLTAWAEVDFAGLGWVAFDPTPTAKTHASLTLQEKKLDAAVNSAVQQSVNHPDHRPASNPNTGTLPKHHSPNRLREVIATVLVLTGLSLMIAFVPLAVKRRRRNQRRRAASAAARVAGAWNEALDRLVEIGLDSSTTLTVRQVVADSREGLTDPAVDNLAALGIMTNIALHGREEPSHDFANDAWQVSDRFRREVKATRSVRQRIRAALSPRPLVGSNRRS